MPASEQRKGGKNLTTSPHRKERYAQYKQVYAKHKLQRILQSCGVEFAKQWARLHTSESVLARLLK